MPGGRHSTCKGLGGEGTRCSQHPRKGHEALGAGVVGVGEHLEGGCSSNIIFQMVTSLPQARE